MKLVGANLILVLMAVFTIFASAADNEVFITQSGTNAQIEIDQIGSGNTVEGNEAAGSEPISDFKLTGNSQTIDINQVGDSNIFRGDIVMNLIFNLIPQEVIFLIMLKWMLKSQEAQTILL